MIEFDINKLRVETYKVKALTTALGGSISVLDEEKSTEHKEVYHRIPVPMAVVRAFKVRHNTMKYIRPCLIAVAFYDDRAIALERHPAGCMGERWGVSKETQERVDAITERWVPTLEFNIENVIRPLVEEGEKKWYFDGRYIFCFEGGVDEAVAKAQRLSKDGRFRCIDVDAVGLHKLEEERRKLAPVDRTCLAYVAKNGQYAISPPIWKNARQVGEAKIKGCGRGEDDRAFSFDTIDDYCAVNISFALKAAKELSEEFGFEAIEPLNLPGLMVRLNTVNLPKVPTEVKDTFDSGMKFTHALAWLLGFARRCHDLGTYASIRSLLKYLTSNGLFLTSSFDPSNIFRSGHDLDSIPVLSKEEAASVDLYKITLEERQEMMRNRRQHSRPGNVIGGALHVDEDD